MPRSNCRPTISVTARDVTRASSAASPDLLLNSKADRAGGLGKLPVWVTTILCWRSSSSDIVVLHKPARGTANFTDYWQPHFQRADIGRTCVASTPSNRAALPPRIAARSAGLRLGHL